MRCSGHIYDLFMYDVGGEVSIGKLEKVLKKLPQFVELKYTKLTPEYVTISPAPLEVELVKKKKIDDSVYSIFVRIYEIGVVTVSFRKDFDCEFKELVKGRVQTDSLRKEADSIAEKTIADIREFVIKGYEREKTPEDYRLYVIKKLENSANGKKFLEDNRKEIAALLREEKDPNKLSDEEVERAIRAAVSYHKADLAVVGYIGALIIEPQNEFDALITLELANIQLLEFRTYDRLLDAHLNRAYEDLKEVLQPTPLALFRSGKIERTAKSLAEIRMYITEILSDIINISKFIGDWYTARVYKAAAERLHLQDWQNGITRKLDVLEDFYTMGFDRVSAYRGFLLEWAVVILIIMEMLIMALELVRM